MAKVEDPATRLERLKKLVAGHTPLPSVSVVIPEQHLRAMVVDPAAQTEIKLLLQQIGFEVIDPEPANRQADVQIAGEAFSEFAGRHGNLLSCRARVEIRMSRLGTSKLLLADRETAVAVDVAEDMAGKAALERAAARLSIASCQSSSLNRSRLLLMRIRTLAPPAIPGRSGNWADAVHRKGSIRHT